MTPAAEYAFVGTARFVGDASSASSPSALTAARTLAPTFALNQLGYIARAFSLFGDAPIADELRGAKALVLNAAEPGCEERYQALLENVGAAVFYDLAEIPAPGTPKDAWARNGAVRLTAASEYVAEKASALVGRAVATVPEPLQGMRGAPRPPQAGQRSRLWQWLARRAGMETQSWSAGIFWSGENHETAAMLAALPELASLGEKLRVRLHCIAPDGGALEQLALGFPATLAENLRPTLEAWSPRGVQDALASSDLVLLPDPGAASRSRLIGALHAGRFCVARSSPHFGHLADYAWVGDDLAAGIRWALSNPDAVLSRLVAGQRYLDAVHAPAAVARNWVQFFTRA